MKIEKILLIDPPFFRFMGERQSSTPLGLAYIAGTMRKHGFDTAIYNADFEHREEMPECNKAFLNEVSTFDLYRNGVTDISHPIYKEVLSVIAQTRPDLIGMTVRTGKFFVSKTLISLIKESFPDTPLVIGGNHVTADPEHSLRRTKADYAVRGEGEQTFLLLVESLNKNERLPGLNSVSFRSRGEIVHNPRAPLIQDLDSLPYPDRDAILYKEAMSPIDFGNIFSSRGCPFSCTFCDSRTTWTRKVRRRSAKNVVEEMLALKAKYGTSFFSFSDDCFVTKVKQTFDLCDEIDRSGLSSLRKKQFRWWCEIHPHLITEPLVTRMKKAGCVAIAIGAESGSQRTLDHINKASSVDVIRRAAAIIKACDVDLTTFFMIGFPWEKEEDIKATIELMAELDPDSGNLSILTPLPSTPVYSYCAERGLVQYHEDYLDCFHQRNSFFCSDGISEERSKEIIMEAFRRVDELIEGNRKKKIERTLQSTLLPKLESAFGLRFHLNRNGNGKGLDQSDITLSCDQIYAQATVQLTLSAADDLLPEHIATAVKKYLASEVLSELPQYAKVEFTGEI